MHIVQITHEPLPITFYGGIERIIENLCTGLTELNHKVTLICYKGDYQIPHVTFKDLGPLHSAKTKTPEHFLKLIPEDADIIHFHLPLNQDQIDLKGKPYICTLHGNLQDHQDPYQLPVNTVCISQNHASRHKRNTFVYNGLDQEKIPLCPTNYGQAKYFSFLGKASLKRKGLHLAKNISKNLKMPLHVGGGRGLSFFNTKYLGPLNDHQKYKLLGNSRALLFPILWDEPFGLVMIEAMFSGTPVFALDRGSVPEVLGQDGHQNLFLFEKTDQQLSKKIPQYIPSSPQAYRDYAISHFSKKTMCLNYLELYEKVLNKEKLT